MASLTRPQISLQQSELRRARRLGPRGRSRGTVASNMHPKIRDGLSQEVPMGSFEAVMAGHSDVELARIVTELRNDYRPEAVAAAEAALSRRQVTEVQQVAVLEEDAAERTADAKAKAEAPLSAFWRVVLVICPYAAIGLIPVLILLIVGREGYRRMQREAIVWFLAGLGAHVGLVMLVAAWAMLNG